MEQEIVKKIIKRNGSEVDFDPRKIKRAVEKANGDVAPVLRMSERSIEAVTLCVAATCSKLDWTPNVEDIQEMVENELMRHQAYEVAKAYIRYRYKRNAAREASNEFLYSLKDKLEAADVQNQNANVDEHSFGGRIGEATNEMMKQYALNYCMSDLAKFNHLNNRVYTHDLSHYAVGDHNCLSIPYDDLLAKGFNTRQTDVRPANSVNTALQLIAVIAQVQSLSQFGGVSATHLDWTMVPYVRKSFVKHWRDGYHYIARANDELDWDYLTTFSIGNKHFTEKFPKVYQYAMDMTKREVKQGVEGLIHNLNTLQSRSGNQLPFSSINFGTCTLPEGRMVTEAILRGYIAGVGKLHKTPIFPCGIFQMMTGVNRKPGDPNYDLYRLALESTSKRLYPNYANVDWSGNAGYDRNDPKTYFSTMGCRTANGWDINGFGQLKDGRGNICPVTIILPTLAMEAKESSTGDVVERFMEILDTTIHEAKDQLLERFEYICKQNPASAKFMYENGTMKGYIPEEGIRSALKHGTLAVGQLGLAEALEILIGCNHTKPEGMALAKRIEQLFKERCNEFKLEYKLNFGVYYSPAENLCFTAMKKFQQKYGVVPKVSDHDFFTNSMHVPVWEDVDVFQKIDIESQLTGYSSAGCITYVELPSSVQNNLDALETIVNYAMDKDVPYFAVNVPNDTCLDCGFTGEFNDCCPKCGSENIQQLRRVTGYLTGNYKTAFNKGKQQETEMRVKHVGKLEEAK